MIRNDYDMPPGGVEYRFKFISEMKSCPRIFLFNSLPHDPDVNPEGNTDLTRLIHTHNPQLVIAKGNEFFASWTGTSLLVSPGLLQDNSAAIIDYRDRTAEQIKL